jgi:tetratricopeptide (TPR) repeat protein
MTVLLYSSDIAAEVYKCPSANGQWVFSGTPCANGFIQDGNKWISVQEYQTLQANPALPSPREAEGIESTPRPSESEQERKIRERRSELIKQSEQLRAEKAERLKQAARAAQQDTTAAPLTQPAPAAKPLPTPQELAWEQLIKAGQAAYEKRDISAGAKHFLAALRLAQTFDKAGDHHGNWYEAKTFQDMGDPLHFYSLKEALHDSAVLHDDQQAYETLISDRAKTLYTALEPFLQDALRLTETVRGPEHPAVTRALEQLAKCYYIIGRYQEAVALYERMFVVVEKHVGRPLDIKLAPSGGVIDQTYFTLMIRGAAWMEAYLKHLMQVSEKAHGPDHPEIAVAVDYLRHLYREQGRTAEAEKLDQKAQVIAAKAQGPESPKSIEALFSQASQAEGRGSYAEAETLYLEALRLTEKSYGPEDVKNLSAFQAIARFYAGRERYAEADTYYQKYLGLTEKLYRPDAREVYLAVNQLAQHYAAQKRYADAAPLYERALAFTENHTPHGAGVEDLDRLAHTYLALGRRADAAPLLKRAFVMVEKLNDAPGHRSRYLVLGDVALAEGHVDEAEHFYQRALHTDTTVNTAKEILDSIEPRSKLADFYASQKRYTEAEELYKRNLEQVERFRSLWRSEKVNPLMALVDFYTSQNQVAEAEALLKSTLEKVMRGYGERPETAAIRTRLVELFLAQGRKEEADALLHYTPRPRPIPGMRPR